MHAEGFDGMMLTPERQSMRHLHFEDFVAGAVNEYGPRALTREEIVTFAAAFDPQPMHLDEERARAGMLGGLAASGWQSCCLAMRMISDGFLAQSRFMGLSGVEEVRWRAPVRPDEPLRLRATVLETRAAHDRRDAGIVRLRLELVDSRNAVLMTMTLGGMFARMPSSSEQTRIGGA
jgi:acyl dehydratase